MTRRKLIFYHSADFDGHCSGAIAWQVHPDAETIPFNYGDPFPWHLVGPSSLVIMVDVSLPIEDMIRLDALCGVFCWIDHHKTAIEAAEAVGLAPEGLREVGRAACELAWEWFHPHEDAPRAVHLLGRYDVWDHSDPDTLPFQFGLRLERDTTPGAAVWGELLNPRSIQITTVNPIIRRGRVVLDYQANENAKYAASCAFETELEGLRLVAINRRLANSQLFDSVYDPDKHDAMCSFGWQGGEWCFSLYSTKPEVDVSAVAKMYGGGGHKGAAGFSLSFVPFYMR